LVEPKSNRYFFIHDPKEFVVTGVLKQFSVNIPLHPNYPERGYRHFEVNTRRGIAKLWIASGDFERIESGLFRLMELFNVQSQITADASIAVFHSEEYEKARKVKAPLIHWLPKGRHISCQVVLPDASLAKGLVEESCREVKVDTVVQFERFGFVRIDSNKQDSVRAYYCHR
jgi:glutamyl-tRNA synthetase